MAKRLHLGTGSNCKAVAGIQAAVRFTPGASQAAIVVQEQWGVQSITRVSTGLYDIKLQGKVKGMCAYACGQEDDTTNWHVVRVESQTDSTATVRVSHKSVVYASVASGPSFSDTIDAIVVYVYGRAD